ncbi:SixA phosphatase family protein [Demetria terragena]|uniref:SixA phosphatase family protein n=1 Tax=Demetria terragena TaxID=63959 RepID=UPI00047576A6|nr:histidine phosphatase family protein [Demetria terragena]
MTDSTRVLILLRHAKAADPEGRADRDRPLTERGVADATAAGEWLKDENLLPTQVFCSPALRTRQTWSAVVEATGQGGLVDHDERIYNASDEQLLQVLRETDDNASTVALVGHSPGVPMLAALLDDGNGDQVARASLGDSFPTCTAAVFRISTAWADLAAGSAELVEVRTSRFSA